MKKDIIAKELLKVAKNLVAGSEVFELQFPQKTSKSQMSSELKRNIRQECYLQLQNIIFDNKEKAQAYLENKIWKRDLGVRFKSPIKDAKAEEKYRKKILKEIDDLREYIKSLMNKMQKCSVCNSVINTKYKFNDYIVEERNGTVRYNFDNIYCPVCHNKNFGDFIKDDINVNKMINKINKMVENKRKKQNEGQFELKWLVMCERRIQY